jgi:hypothetical protein
LQIFFDDTLYDERALHETAAVFADIVEIDIERRDDGLVATIPADEQADAIAGEFVNIALARSMESRG